MQPANTPPAPTTLAQPSWQQFIYGTGIQIVRATRTVQVLPILTVENLAAAEDVARALESDD